MKFCYFPKNENHASDKTDSVLNFIYKDTPLQRYLVKCGLGFNIHKKLNLWLEKLVALAAYMEHADQE